MGNIKNLCIIVTKWLAVGLFIVALGVVVIFCYLRLALTGKQVADFLAGRIESASGLHISFSSAELIWPTFYQLQLSIRDIAVANQTTGLWKEFEAPELVLVINLPYAFGGNFYVETAALDSPRIMITTDRSPEIQPEQTVAHTGTLLRPLIDHLEFTGGTIELVDKAQEPSKRIGTISQVQFTAKNTTPAGIESFQFQAFILGGENPGVLNMAGRVDRKSIAKGGLGLDMRLTATGVPATVFQHVGFYYGFPPVLRSGTMDFEVAARGDSDQWAAKGSMGIRSVSIMVPELFLEIVPVEEGGFDFSLRKNGDQVALEVPNVSFPGITGDISLAISQLTGQDPFIDLLVRKVDLQLESLLPYVPLNLFSGEDRHHLLKSGLKGHATIKDASWSGNYSQIRRRSLARGRLGFVGNFDKISGFVPGIGLPIGNATGEVRIGEKGISFRGISFTLGNSPIVLNGGISDLKNSPVMDLFVSMTAEARDLQPLSQSLAAIEHLAPHVNRLTDFSGGVSVTLNLKGPVSRPEAKGLISLDNFECRLGTFPLPLKKVTGKLRFRGTGISTPEIKGNLGSSPFLVKGSITPDAVDVVVESKIQGSDLRHIEGFPRTAAISGSVPCQIELRGKPNVINFVSVVELRSNAITIGQIMDKRPGVPLRIELSGMKDSSVIKIEEIALTADKVRISGRGFIREDGRTTLSINLPPKGIPSDSLMPLLNPALEMQGGGRIEGDLLINSSQLFTNAALEINAVLSHLSLRLPGMHKRAEGLTGTIKHRSNSHQFVMERVKVGNSIVWGTLSVTEFENPRIEVVLESSHFETTDFTAPPGFIHKLTWGEFMRINPVVRFLARVKGTGFLKITKGKIGERTFEDFRANLEGNSGLIKVTSWQTLFAEGILRGTGLFDIRLNSTKPLSVEFQGDRLKMEKTMRADPGWLRVSGDVFAEGTLDWKLGPSVDKRGMYKTGRIEVRMNEGVINRFDILSKLFSLVNLGSLLRGKLPDVIGQGLPFHRLTWTMEVFDNKWKVSDLRLLSDAARVDSSGMYFSGQERIDFRMDVSPLVGFDAIFQGLFGNLITRNGKILSTTFRIRGLYSSPDVRLEPFENLRLEER